MSINISTHQWSPEMVDLGACPICQEDLLLEGSIHPAFRASVAPSDYASSNLHPAAISAALPSFQGHEIIASNGARVYHLMHLECAEGLLATSRRCALCKAHITHIEGTPAPALGVQSSNLQQQIDFPDQPTESSDDEWDDDPITTRTLVIPQINFVLDTEHNDMRLIQAAHHGDIETVQSLIAAGVNPNLVDITENSALILASRHGHKDIVEALIRAGGNLNHRNRAGETALIEAASENQIDIVQILITAGADLNLQDEDDNTALMRVAFSGYTAIAKSLIEGGANLNLSNRREETALMKAVLWNRLEIVKALITSGANMYLQNQDGDNALMFATNQEIRTLILDVMRLQALKESDLGSELEGTDLVLELISEYAHDE